MHRANSVTTAIAMVVSLQIGMARAQSGVSDDRVSVPDGPGSIEGIGDNASVAANMGLMSYSVPFDLPAGFSGVTPSLGLSYASGNGNTIAGIGWMMRVPSIERLTLRGLPSYDADDELTVDGGTQLVRVSSSGTTAVYRERFEGAFVRYTWHDRGAAGYITAEYPDGSVGTFGATADGTAVPESCLRAPDGRIFRYHLVERVDVFGHRVRYGYTQFDGSPYLTSVGYVHGANDAPRYTVALTYGPRPDAFADGKPGFEERITRRLAEVSISTNAERIRRYALTYESAEDSGGLSRLAQVESFGRNDSRYPVVFTFGYSRALGGVCSAGSCDAPFVVDMGALPPGGGISSGDATLVDINGDSLPDLVDAHAVGPHVFLLNRLDGEGRSSFAPDVYASETATRSAFQLSLPNVEPVDMNGDGFADLVNTLTGNVLCNDGSGDWRTTGCVPEAGLGFVPDGTQSGLRYLDVDGDRRIDIVRTTSATVIDVWRNTGAGFEPIEDAEPIGAAFDVDQLLLADMNGDGLLDPVEIGGAGTVRYRGNIGRGRWLPWLTLTTPSISPSERASLALEDLNGDGLDDLVVVGASSIKYALNRAGTALDDFVTLDSTSIASIPTRTSVTTILFADMNGNGSSDVVWVQPSRVFYAELFPVLPNLLSRIENGIGMVQEVTYGTAISERSADGSPWTHPLTVPVNVVTRLDSWTTLTGDDDGEGLHEVVTYRYHDGFYDGVEKQLRGFATVEERTLADASGDTQEPGATISTFDVGDTDAYRAGRVLTVQTSSGAPGAERALIESRTTYADCDVAEVPSSGLRFEVRFVCETERRTIVKEGAAPDAFRTLRTAQTYDGYGQVVVSSAFGVEHLGSPEAPTSCGVCTRAPATFGEACGPTCTGDERFVETTFIAPGPDTNGRWMLGKASLTRAYGVLGGPTSEERIRYDGEPFVGRTSGLTEGRVTRVTRRIREGSGDVVDIERNAHDADGNVTETIDPNGAIDRATTHRRTYAYDASGLRVVRTELLLETPEAQPYRLRREYSYDPALDKLTEATGWMVIEGATNRSARNATGYRYDEFGRRTAIRAPGDAESTPTIEFEWVLADPASFVRVRSRSVRSGTLDLEEIRCFDGRGRAFQTRTRLDDGRYQVSGFTAFNARGAAVRTYRPHEASGAACATSEPSGVAYFESRYDASNRLVARTLPEGDFGARPSTRVEYGPLRAARFDEADADPALETPDVTITDGLGRVVQIIRALREDGQPARPVATTLTYDGLGHLSAYEDALGHTKREQHDLLGRVERIDDPNSGTTTLEYDAAGNIVRSTDMRGVVTTLSYDGANRLVGKAAEGADAIRYRYDRPLACDAALCRNGEGRLVEATYPLHPELTPFVGAGAGRDEYGYDARGRRLHSARVLGTTRFESSHVVDNVGRPLETVFPDGQRLAYAYDGASRVVQIGDFIEEVSYDAIGLVERTVRADGTVETFGYDVYGHQAARRIEGADGVYESVEMRRDVRGLLVEVTDDTQDEAFASLDATYEHDGWGRLVGADLEATDNVEHLTFAYDDTGAPLAATSSLGTSSTAHLGELGYAPEQPGVAIASGRVAATYDAAGLVATRAAQRFEWDHLARLSRVASSDDDAIATRYVYGPDERCVAIVEPEGAVLFISEDFEVRDGIARVHPRLDGRVVGRSASDVVQTSLYEDLAPSSGPDGVITAADARAAVDRGTQIVRATHRAAARRLLHAATPGVTHLYADALHSVTVATRAGERVGRRAYHPFGQLRDQVGFVDEHGFTGQERDRTTGLDRFRFRWLDTSMAQWASPDPAFQSMDISSISALAQSVGRYRYVENQPTDAFDPLGLAPEHLSRSFGTLRQNDHLSHIRVAGAAVAERGNRTLRQTVADVNTLSAHLGNFEGRQMEVGRVGNVEAYRYTRVQETNNPTVLGRYFSPTPHPGTGNVRDGLAVPRQWQGATSENVINRFVRVQLEGRLAGVGTAAPQTGTFGEFRPGEGAQILVPHTAGIPILGQGPFPTPVASQLTSNGAQ